MSNTEDWIRDRRNRDFVEKYKNSHKLLCDGVVIDQVPGRHPTDFAVRLLTNFRDNILQALSDPGFLFDGKQSGAEWLVMQEARLGVKLSSNLSIVGPGEVLPLCEYLARAPERIY